MPDFVKGQGAVSFIVGWIQIAITDRQRKNIDGAVSALWRGQSSRTPGAISIPLQFML
jgi:hypothetical protein